MSSKLKPCEHCGEHCGISVPYCDEAQRELDKLKAERAGNDSRRSEQPAPSKADELEKAILEAHTRYHGRRATHQQVARKSGWTPTQLDEVLDQDEMLMVDEIMQLIQAQKLAHGEMVIGEDEEWKKRGDDYIEIADRNAIRAEQRKRNVV